MKISAINALLKGKNLSFYDSSNGSLIAFTVGHVMTRTSSCVRCFSAMNKENYIDIPHVAIDALVRDGRYELCVESIYVRKLWTLTK